MGIGDNNEISYPKKLIIKNQPVMTLRVCGACSHYVNGLCREPLGMIFDVDSDGNMVDLVCEVDEYDFCSNWKRKQ